MTWEGDTRQVRERAVASDAWRCDRSTSPRQVGSSDKQKEDGQSVLITSGSYASDAGRRVEEHNISRLTRPH